ncbi:MAG: TrmH family RNA methyltransferase [bacterium]|nr:TrmH family RNA methyltransferase [bacterium]
MIALLYNIRSLHNVGSIFRTADAVGVEKIYLTGITPAPVDIFGKPRQQLTKVSLGAEKYVKWEKVGSAHSPQSISKLIEKLKEQDYKIFCVEQNKKSIPYYKVKIKNAMTRHSVLKIALVLGNEIKGLPASILKRSDKILEIPMRGKKESLNVAVAFGIIAFHLINAKT